MLIAVWKNEFIASFIIIFGTLSFPTDVDVQTVVVLGKWNDDGVRRRHDLIGCSQTRAVSAQSDCVPWKFTLENMRFLSPVRELRL